MKTREFITKKRIKEASSKSIEDLIHTVPMLAGGIMIFVLVNNMVTVPYEKIFKNIMLWDSFVGALIGGAMTGEALSSYILGKEFLDSGVSLLAVTAFLASWISVGVTNIPFESVYLGKRFAFMRNLTSFVFSIIIAIVLVLILGRKL